MSIVHILVLTLAFILNSIGLSSEFECLPDGAPIPGVSRSMSSRFPEFDSLLRDFSPPEPAPRFRSRSPPAELHSSDRPLPLAKRPLRSISKFLPARHVTTKVLGFRLEQLKFIRLIPKSNPKRLFGIQRYTFPEDKPIRLRAHGINSFRPMPTEEQIVLTTSTGDILAILEGNRYFRGIYTERYFYEIRVKMNMYSGAIEDMTQEECVEASIGIKHLISKDFEIVTVESTHPDD